MKKKVFRINLFLLLILVMLLSASCGKNRATTMKLIKTDAVSYTHLRAHET